MIRRKEPAVHTSIGARRQEGIRQPPVPAGMALSLALLLALLPTLAPAQPSVPGQEQQEEHGQAQGSGSSPQASDQQEADESSQPETSRVRVRERVMVIGDPSGVDGIPGSAAYLGGEELEQMQVAFGDVHRMLRWIPGINIQEEEGYGLRPNIGMRGTGVDRSAKITLMEDGVLIAPAPYAAPAAYYFPTAGRMQALEVRKGSSQIKYGPRTNGGALNLISTPIPYGLSFRANLGFGSDRTGKAHASIGDSGDHFGWLLETYQISTDGFKELDGGGDTGFNLEDYLAKFRVNSDRSARVYQELQIKLGKTEQVSDETYLGLTDPDFRAAPFRRYAASREDVFRSDHEQFQARYFVSPSAGLDLTAVVYRNNFKRNWYKLQSILGTSISKIFDDPDAFASELAIARGADSGPDALRVRANNREYTSQGVQTILGLTFERGRARNVLEFGLRYHEDQEDRLQHEDGFQMLDGRMVLTSRGAPGSQANRISDASAWAFFVQDRIEWGRWSLIPGLRVESVDLVRTDFARDDPERTRPTRVRENQVDVVIPGVGVSYQLSPAVGLFGGVHKGFAPPGPGSTEETEAEESVNYEFGARLRDGSVRVELVGFFNDYENLLGKDTLATGGTGTGDLFNGGEVHVVGAELSVQADLTEGLGGDLSVPVRFAYTLTRGEFQNSFESDFGPWGNVEAGDELPYLPRHQVYASLGLERSGWSLLLDSHYVSRMRTAAGSGPILPQEATDSYLVFNLTGERALGEWASLFATVQNLTDRAYIVARRPAGARPGLPRTFMAGIKLNLR